MFNTKRVIKKFAPGDEIEARISDVKISGANLALTLVVIDNGKESGLIIYHTFGSYDGKGRYFFEDFLDAINAPEDITSERWFIGKMCRFICKENTWNEKTFLAVDSWLKSKSYDDPNIWNLHKQIDKVKDSSSALMSSPVTVDEDFFLVTKEDKPKKSLRKIVNVDEAVDKVTKDKDVSH